MSYPTHIFTEIVKDKTGSNKKLAQELFLSKGTYPIIDQGKKFIAGYTNDEQSLMQSTELPVVIFGDHTKSIKYIDFPFALGADGVKILKPIEACEVKYLYHFLLHAKIPDAGYSRHFKFLKELQIPLPPLEEQRRITEILDKADALIQNRKKAIEKLDELLQATFIDIFGDPVTNPKGWEQCIFEDLIYLITYGLTIRPKYHEMGIPLISAREIRTGKLNFHDSPKISQVDFEKLSLKAKPSQDDILFSKTGSIGHCAIVEENNHFAITQNVARITPKLEICNPIFLLYFMRTHYFYNLANKEAKGNAVKDLQLGTIRKFPMYSPPIYLQNKWSDFAKTVEAQKQRMQEQLDAQETLFKSLQQQAFSGQL